MAAKQKKMWFGFLEAGTKGSPVVRDATLETGDPKTVYLFNYMKGKILEYRRDIVEIKLREFESEELTMIPQLRKAFKEVRESFEPRPAKPKQTVYRAKPAPAEDDDFPEFDAGDDDDFDDVPPPLLDADDEPATAFLAD
jgi:hypothetical protein